MNLTLYFCRFLCAFSLLSLTSSKRFLAYSERMAASLMMRARSSSSASFLRSSSNFCSIWTCFSFSLNLSLRSLFSVCSLLNTRMFCLTSLASLKLNATLWNESLAINCCCLFSASLSDGIERHASSYWRLSWRVVTFVGCLSPDTCYRGGSITLDDSCLVSLWFRLKVSSEITSLIACFFSEDTRASFYLMTVDRFGLPTSIYSSESSMISLSSYSFWSVLCSFLRLAEDCYDTRPVIVSSSISEL